MEPVLPENNNQAKSNDEKSMAMLCHLAALAGFIVPFGSILGPLIIWLVKKEDMPVVDRHGRESLNFQFTMLIAYIVCFLLIFVAVGLLLLPIVALFSFIMVIVASIKAYEGKEFSYPLTIRFL
ncbi:MULTISPECIES: DUF4870 domain-containing protein [unclassified Pseudoalteromonas]|uniref:DUF4870 domain-containing protein n=1 Tax=unclassified Pseudoalteromonas TaxID=194690 RepID=UPI000CF6A17F|nr:MULTISPECIES: DUF4870 domain-containing protein [unclassified Pseudoalteromonas]MBS3797075.1 DUF4870 domain-containing protein [Pseudoalteromonas sp. BDTF-M6]